METMSLGSHCFRGETRRSLVLEFVNKTHLNNQQLDQASSFAMFSFLFVLEAHGTEFKALRLDVPLQSSCQDT